MYIPKYLLTALFMLLFVANSKAQISGKIALSEDNTRYELYIIPNFNASPPLSITNNTAQISFRAPIGELQITNLESVTGTWTVAAIVNGPIENPGYSYVSISLNNPLIDIVYEAGQEILLFTFENNIPECTGPIELIDTDDPFFPPNSEMINLGNQLSILALGNINAFEGATECCAPCPEEEEMEEEPEEETPPVPGQPTVCRGGANELFLNTNSDGSAPYQILWTNITTGAIDSLTINEITIPLLLAGNAAPGTYEIMLTDADGGTIEVIEEIADNSYILHPQLIVTNIGCGESNTGRLFVNNTGNVNRNFSYEWSNGVMDTPQIDNLPAGDYLVTVTDEDGCAAIQLATVIASGEIQADIQQLNVSCHGMNDGRLTAEMDNTTNYTFQWEGNGISETTAGITNLSPGEYALTITDASGVCAAITQNFEITEPEPLAIETQLLEQGDCETLTENTILVNTITDNQRTVQFALDDSVFSNNNRFTVPTGASYDITAMDELGCTASRTVNVPESSNLILRVPEQIILPLGDEMELAVEYESISDVTFQWIGDETLSCMDCSNPTISPRQTTTYTLILSDDNGCSKEATIIVFVTKEENIFAPTAFSPNNDGINDYFNIFVGNDVEFVNSFQVYNRWGIKVFQSASDYVSNVNELGWNGAYNGRLAESGVYIYFAEVIFLDGSTGVLSGEVSLIR